jgi:protein TonB
MRRVGNFMAVLALCAGLLAGTSAAQESAQEGRKVIARTAPVYPDLARRTHLSGVVKLEVVIRPNGSVKETKVLGGNPVLLDSAAAAVREWKFEPGPAETTETVRLSFTAH